MGIVARWEWRSFGDGFGAAEQRIQKRGAHGPVRESAEIYVLAAGCPDNTKIRAGQMDIKRLRQVNAAGLEQWEPVFKESFPLDMGQVAEVFDVWGITPPLPPTRPLDLDEFLRDWVAPSPTLRAVQVHKQRTAFTVDGAIVELADLRIDGAPLRTVAVEHADAGLVQRVVTTLGLGALPNLNYLAGIRRQLGLD